MHRGNYMKVSEMMKYPRLRKLLEVNWKNNATSGMFGTDSMEDRLSLGFDWMESKVPFIPSRIGVYHFWNNLHWLEGDIASKKYPELFEVEESNSVKFAKWCVGFKHSSNCERGDDNGRLTIEELRGVDAPQNRHYFVSTSEDVKRSVEDEAIPPQDPYQLIARLLLNTSHEYNGRKQVEFNTHIAQEELLGIADCINNILEAEDREGFVTIRWSTPKSVDLYLDYAWSEEGDRGHKDQRIASWEW